MCKYTIALAAAGVFALAAPAGATVTTTDYAFASDVGPGAFTLSCDDAQPYPCSLAAFDFTLGGTAFDTSNTEIVPAFVDLDPSDGIPPMFLGGYTIGGFGADVLDQYGAAPDFKFDFSPSQSLPVSGALLLTYIPGQGIAPANITISLAEPPPSTGAVPEPSTWAMMLLGFAAVGASLRYRRRSKLPQLA
jgi:hypothetical protein